MIKLNTESYNKKMNGYIFYGKVATSKKKV